MSDSSNDKLYERAQELLDEFTSHPSGCDKSLAAAIMRDDLEEIRYWVNTFEGVLAQENFRDYDLAVY
jgi:hypothetical protein